jgi:hypothetical protein
MNRGPEPVRMLVISTHDLPAVAVHPDSDTIGVFTAGGHDEIMVRRAAGRGPLGGRAAAVVSARRPAAREGRCNG